MYLFFCLYGRENFNKTKPYIETKLLRDTARTQPE